MKLILSSKMFIIEGGEGLLQVMAHLPTNDSTFFFCFSFFFLLTQVNEQILDVVYGQTIYPIYVYIYIYERVK